MNTLFTIGYTSFELQDFVAALQKHGIEALADVRSSPYSSRYAEYNREHLRHALKEAGIAYVFLGDLIGARVDDPAAYKDGVADYTHIARTQAFQKGLERVRKGLERYRVALMCAEKDPITCHRMVLIFRNIAFPCAIQHISADSGLESHTRAEMRLLQLFGLDQPDLFSRSEAQRLAEAYAGKGKRSQQAVKKAPFLWLRSLAGMSDIRLFTIGFTKKPAETFFSLLQNAGVRLMVDVRLNNNSQLAGYSKRDDLAYFLRTILQCDYEHRPLWAPTSETLAAYRKGEISWDAYEQDFNALLAQRGIENHIESQNLDAACLLCSEAEPVQCHRRLVAEYLQARLSNMVVQHL